MWDWSENKITIVMIRHGATKENKEHRYLGKSDVPLVQEGVIELFEYRKLNRYPQVDYLFTSPMKRCIETAEIIYPGKKAVMIPEWEEMDFGEFECKNYIELKEDERYQEWIDSNGTLPFPNGECRKDFCNRCVDGFRRMTEQLDKRTIIEERKQSVIGIIAHGGTIMALLSHYYGGDYFDYQVSNGGGYVCNFEGGNRELRITKIIKL